MKTKDFNYWLSKTDLENEPYLLILSIDPDYYKNATKHEVVFQTRLLNILKDYVKWNNDWDDFINQCYERGVFLTEDNQKDFYHFLKDNNKIPFKDDYEKYCQDNYNIFRPNYDEWLKKEAEITQHEAVCLSLGVDPRYYTLEDEYRKEMTYGSYSDLDDNKKIYFLKCYAKFLDENYLLIGIKSIQPDLQNYLQRKLNGILKHTF